MTQRDCFKRPSGTVRFGSPSQPSDKSLGYSQTSLRDRKHDLTFSLSFPHLAALRLWRENTAEGPDPGLPRQTPFAAGTAL